MALYEVSIAAATAVVGYDLLSGESWTVDGRDRVVRGIALAGSAAAGDTIIEVKAASNVIAKKYNQTTGFPNRDNMLPVNGRIPAGQKITAPVVDAAATNAINLILDVV